MMCSEIQAYLPANFEMLLVGSQSNTMNRDVSDVVCLSMPLKVHELLQTVEMMAYTYEKKRKKRRAQPKERTEEEKKADIKCKKKLLMERNQMSEEEAHRYIQKSKHGHRYTSICGDRTDGTQSDECIIEGVMDMKFTKMQGIGNDYVYVNCFEEKVEDPALGLPSS